MVKSEGEPLILHKMRPLRGQHYAGDFEAVKYL